MPGALYIQEKLYLFTIPSSLIYSEQKNKQKIHLLGVGNEAMHFYNSFRPYARDLRSEEEKNISF